MNNLKRVLSLALSGIMLVGMMAIGASAAEFSDADKIVNADAVDTMVALNIINGKDDGSFDPEAVVTRAEMAKMITVALNGGKDPVLGTSATPKFSDIGGHWAQKYIEYCANLSIINGRGDGTFDPAAPVTGTEAAKMMLVAMGYDSTVFKFTGPDWAMNVNIEASNAKPNKLYAEIENIDPNQGLSRDNAAQLIFNGIQDKTMQKSPSMSITNGEITYDYTSNGPSILTDKYGAKTVYTYLNGVTYDADKDEYKYSVSTEAFGGAEITDDALNTDFTYGKDVSSLFGHKVKVIYKEKANKIDTVLGVFPSDSAVLVSGVVGKLPTIAGTDTSKKIEGTTFKFDGDSDDNKKDTAADVKVYEFLKDTSIGTLAATGAEKAWTYDLIDNDGNGKVDAVVVYPFTVAEVTFVNKTSITAGSSYKFEDCDIYEGVKKGDWAIITAAENTGNDTVKVVKAEVVSGTVSAVKSDDKQVKVDGEWYTANENVFATVSSVGDDFDMVVVNGYIFDAEKTTETASVENAVYALGVDAIGTGLNEGRQKVELLFTDGTKKIVTVDKTDKKTAGTLADIAADNAVVKGDLFTYKTDKDGNYELTQIKAADFDKAVDGTNAITVNEKKAKVNGATYYFADDAVVFVHVTDSNSKDVVKVLSGADVNKWKKDGGYATAGSDTSALYANASDGFNYVALGLLNLTGVNAIPGASGDTKYGYITAKSAFVKEGDDSFIEITLWNGEDTVTVLAESLTASETDPVKGDEDTYARDSIVSYQDLGGNKIGSVAVMNGSNAGADAVTGYAGGKAINFKTLSTVTELDDDTVILYVDTADHSGVEGGSISVAAKDAAGAYVKNVYAYAAASDNTKLELLVVDVTNNLSINKDASGLKADGTVITALDTTAKTATIAAGKTIAQVEEVALDSVGTNVGGIKVTKGAGNTNKTNVESKDVLHITGTDGTDHAFTITVAGGGAPAGKPATSFALSANTAEVKADSKTATVTVTITPNDADSNNTVTATSEDDTKVTASVADATVTITLADSYTAATPGTDETVKVSIKVGNLTAQDVTVTIKNS